MIISLSNINSQIDLKFFDSLSFSFSLSYLKIFIMATPVCVRTFSLHSKFHFYFWLLLTSFFFNKKKRRLEFKLKLVFIIINLFCRFLFIIIHVWCLTLLLINSHIWMFIYLFMYLNMKKSWIIMLSHF